MVAALRRDKILIVEFLYREIAHKVAQHSAPQMRLNFKPHVYRASSLVHASPNISR